MAKVDPVPQGYRTLTPTLTVRGAAAAIDWYKKVFNAVEQGRFPAPDGRSIWHADLIIGDTHLMLADEMPQMGSKSPQGLGGTPTGIWVYAENADELFERAVANGAKVVMPMTEQFWGDRMGAFVDPFGFHWSLAVHVKDLTPEEMRKASEEAARQFAK